MRHIGTSTSCTRDCIELGCDHCQFAGCECPTEHSCKSGGCGGDDLFACHAAYGCVGPRSTGARQPINPDGSPDLSAHVIDPETLARYQAPCAVCGDRAGLRGEIVHMPDVGAPICYPCHRAAFAEGN